MKRPIGFGRGNEEEIGGKKTGTKKPIGFGRKEYSLSEEISHIIDMKFPPEETICLVAEKMADAYFKTMTKRDEYLALGAEIKKIGKMKKFKELMKAAKKWVADQEEVSLELAKVYKSMGFCEYITGRKKDGVENLSLGIIALLSLGKTEQAFQEIEAIVSLASNEKQDKAEKVLKTLFKEMVDSQHPYGIIGAGNALAEFYKQNKMYKKAADVYGDILIIYQTNLANIEIAEMYTERVLPAFLECKKKADEDVIPSLLVAFDDMYHVAARDVELVHLERLREIIKMMINEIDGQTPDEMKEILERFGKYIELFRMRKKQYKIGEKEFFIDAISDFMKHKRRVRQKFE